MSIKVLSNGCYEFGEGEAKATTKMGFCELPDWVEKDEYYHQVVDAGLIKPFTSSETAASTEKIAKGEERVKELNVEISALEEKLEKVKSTGDEKVKALKEEIAELEAKAASLKESNGNGGNTRQRR